MALKPDRQRNRESDDITFFMNEVAVRGGIVVTSTVGSGAAMDQATNLCTYAANPSGKLPIGILLVDMVNKDLTQTHLNPYNGEVQQGGKVLLSPQGTVHTNMIYPGLTITAPQTAYVGPSGLFTNAASNTQNAPAVGYFITNKDEDGYAKVRINLPLTSPVL